MSLLNDRRALERNNHASGLVGIYWQAPLQSFELKRTFDYCSVNNRLSPLESRAKRRLSMARCTAPSTGPSLIERCSELPCMQWALRPFRRLQQQLFVAVISVLPHR